MDKVTRILMLYSKLIQGEIVDKQRFCLETECRSRSFDRDIEDIRIFLSESYQTGELMYDRRVGGYLLTDSMQEPLDNAEYLLVEKVMSDNRILRKDEMNELLFHIALHTANAKKTAEKEKYAIERYAEPEHGKPLLKMFEDLNKVIDNHQVIRICKEGLQLEDANVIPCEIHCRDKRLWLLAFTAEEDMQELRIPLDEIESFAIMRSQSIKERQKIKTI